MGKQIMFWNSQFAPGGRIVLGALILPIIAFLPAVSIRHGSAVGVADNANPYMTYSCEDKSVLTNQEFIKSIWSGDLDTIASQQVDNCAFINTTVSTLNSGTAISYVYREHTSGTHKRWEHRITAKATAGTYYDWYLCADSADSPYNDGSPALFSGKVTITAPGGGG